MARAITTIGFDADDTLWQNERFFRLSEQQFAAMLADYGDEERIAASLLEVEKRNLRHYGFGIKGFTLSMIETAVELTDGEAPAKLIADILAMGREMLSHPIETLPHVEQTLESLSGDYRLVMITKGDLFDQERKLAQSGLGDFFDGIEIVSDKSRDTYARIFARYGEGPERAVMVGHSLKSDILPAIDAGSWGIYVPHDLTWAYERVDPPADSSRFREIADLGALPDLLGGLGDAVA